MTTFGSVCSGIEAASVAWHPLGWKAAWLSEIEPFPCAVLAHHYPDVPNLGDMTKLVRKVLGGEIEAPDVFTGGTPCQAFSVAGKRQSLDDARGNLTLTFVEIADAIDHIRASRGDAPAVVVWENVPGVLSTKDNAFGCFLGALAGTGCELQPAGGRWTDAGCVYGPTRAVAWRVLDAQYFGLAQRRRRVFVVASARNGFDPGAVLFESDGVRRDSPPSREAREVAPTIPARSTAGGGLGTDFDCDGGVVQVCPTLRPAKQWPAEVSSTLDTTFGKKQGLEDQHVNAGCPLFVPVTTHTLRGEGFDASGRCKKAKDGAPRAFLEAALANHNDSCILWPFGRFKSGYGSVGKNGRAHRIMCEMAHGKAPDGADAAHSCGNRLCVNPRHLRWATRGENMADAIAHGTTTRGERHAASKLTEPEVRGVFESLAAGETHQAIADRLGVSRNAITDIAKGKNWSWLREDGTGRGTPLVPVSVALRGREGGATAEMGDDVAFGLRASGGGGDKPHVLAPVATFAIQAGALRTNPASGPDGVGVQADHAYTLEARAEVQAVAHAIRTAQTGSNGWGINTDGVAYTLDSAQQAVAFAQNQRNEVRTMDVAGALAAEPGAKQQTYMQQCMAVRRLTPVECERLMGFPDSYTSIPWRKKPAEDCPDGPRYKALGNSWAVPCVAWIGRRIAAALQLRAAA